MILQKLSIFRSSLSHTEKRRTKKRQISITYQDNWLKRSLSTEMKDFLVIKQSQPAFGLQLIQLSI